MWSSASMQMPSGTISPSESDASRWRLPSSAMTNVLSALANVSATTSFPSERFTIPLGKRTSSACIVTLPSGCTTAS